MPCKLCLERGKKWDGDDPKCAFEGFTFSALNWNCATMNRLRSIARGEYKAARCSPPALACAEDDYVAVIPFIDDDLDMPRFIVIGWYKSRGKTERAFIYRDGDHPENLPWQAAKTCIDYYEKG